MGGVDEAKNVMDKGFFGVQQLVHPHARTIRRMTMLHLLLEFFFENLIKLPTLPRMMLNSPPPLKT